MATKKQLETTKKVREIQKHCDNTVELAEVIGVSKMTMYSRFKNDEWKFTEMAFIDKIHPYYNGLINVDLPEPTSQMQEVLFELLRREKIDTKLILMQCNIKGLRARISDLRTKFGNSLITSNEVISENKYGREIKYVNYSIEDKEYGINCYYSLLNN